jgi:5-methylcytosine-specific restriction endonuclease McrA
MATKATIPKALREQVWLKVFGAKYSGKCHTTWCKNTITVFDFQCGHDKAESKGGETILENLVPICSRCNLSMSNTYTFKEWNPIMNKMAKKADLDYMQKQNVLDYLKDNAKAEK